MRKAMMCVGLLLVLLCVTEVAAKSYRVIMKNGSWVQAQDKPEADGGNARIRLSGGGLAVVPHASIDWEATESWNRAREKDKSEAVANVPPAAVGASSGTITMVGDNGAASVEEGTAPEGEVADTAQPPPGNLGEKRQRYVSLEAELINLRRQKAGLEGRANNVIDLDEASDLRRRAAELQKRIQQILAEQKNLLIEGEAATSNVGDDDKLRRRIRFLNTEIPKLSQEKAQLDSQAANMIDLDQAKVLRGKSDNLFTRIQALEAERDRLIARLSQQQP